MTTARNQAREALRAVRARRGETKMNPTQRASDYACADAASDVWEPLVRDLHQLLAYYDRTSALDPVTRRSMAQRRAAVLRRATEALDG